jgi:hypothetical protein
MHTNEQQRVYMLERYHRRRFEALEYLGGRCKQCGSDNTLEIDHIDPASKAFNVADMAGYSDAKFWREIKKCQLLCRSCHKKKTAVDLAWPEPLSLVCPGCGTPFETRRRGTRVRKFCTWECAKLHQARGISGKQGEPTHGTASAYGYHRCRCETCRVENAARQRRFRAGRLAQRRAADF